MTKMEKLFKGLTQEEIHELNALMSGTHLDIANGVFTTFQLVKKAVSVATREGQDMLEAEGYTLKFGMVQDGTDEDGFVTFAPMMLAQREGEEKVRFPGIRKAEVAIQNLSSGKGRQSISEKLQIWAMKDSGMTIAQIAESFGRKQETIFKVLNEDRPVKA